MRMALTRPLQHNGFTEDNKPSTQRLHQLTQPTFMSEVPLTSLAVDVTELQARVWGGGGWCGSARAPALANSKRRQLQPCKMIAKSKIWVSFSRLYLLDVTSQSLAVHE